MGTTACEIVWTKRAQLHLKQVYDYINEESPKNAFTVIEDIVEQVNKAAINPTKNPTDKYKLNNDGTYRTFVKHHYRVSYRISNNIIRVLWVRHTSRKPIMW